MAAPIHILFQDLYDIREARGDNHYYPPDIAPPHCIVCGALHTTCVDNSGTFVPLSQMDGQPVLLPEV